MNEGLTLQQEEVELKRFREENRDLFEKDDFKLYIHLLLVGALLLNSTLLAVFIPFLPAKILFGGISSFFWFCFINVTIHHHMTHRNAASSESAKKLLDFIYKILII